MIYSVWGTVISREEREKQLAPSNAVSIAMVYDSKECQNKTYENYIYVNHIYVCSITYTFVSHCQGPAARTDREESEKTDWGFAKSTGRDKCTKAFYFDKH